MKYIAFILTLFIIISSEARLKEYDKYYEIDIKEPIPDLEKLQKEYNEVTSNYNWKYQYTWNMPTTFDPEFRNKISTFGTIEKRIPNVNEDELYQQLIRTPKEYYQYIGPALHNIPGLSGKILDMPGIKETKNQFPKKIASIFKNIPDIEFISPELYVYLMPQMWGEDLNLEKPHNFSESNPTPRVGIEPEILKEIHNKVPVEKFALGHKEEKKLPQRNYFFDKNSSLDSADVEAFIGTMENVTNFINNKDNEIKLIQIDYLLQYWDTKNGENSAVYQYKSMVNPCQTFVRKIKWTNLRTEFQQAIGQNGFGIDDWAYVCEKTIKAYRVNNLNSAWITSLRLWNKGTLYKLYNLMGYSKQNQQRLKYLIEANIRLFDANEQDVKAIKEHKYELKQNLLKWKNYLGGTFIMLN